MVRRTVLAATMLCLAGLLAGTLAGCGRGGETARSKHDAALQARADARKSAGAAAAVLALDADMVSAVAAGANNTDEQVNLKFRVREPPRVGEATRVELALVQKQGLDIDNLLVSLLPAEGLALESDRTVEFKAPAAGATQRIPVVVRAGQAGLLSLNVTVLVESASGSITRNFSIPLIAVEAAG